MLVKRKYKVCRRLGDGIFNKCQSPVFIRAMAAKKRGGLKKRAPRARSEYASQLLDKQKARFTYLIRERQFSNYVEKAEKTKGVNSADLLYKLLERRLDNVLYRSGFAISRAAARQLVSHGHILVNGSKVTIPSYQVSVGNKISIREGSKSRNVFKDLVDKLKNFKMPKWLNLDHEKLEVEIVSLPGSLEQGSTLNLNSVMEFYSRT
ncbi:MAG: 30S ribosomal protein S4 [Candidatus Vogelbacteria bacterium]|nr:30S ribosomal protein S4 [Candidatus Vogelbacteria bacterium]